MLHETSLTKSKSSVSNQIKKNNNPNLTKLNLALNETTNLQSISNKQFNQANSIKINSTPSKTNETSIPRIMSNTKANPRYFASKFYEKFKYCLILDYCHLQKPNSIQ